MTATWTVLNDLGASFTALAAAPDGPVWAADATHLVRLEGHTAHLIPLPAELRAAIAARPSLMFPALTTLLAQANETVWLSGPEIGLYRWAGGTWGHFSEADGLPAAGALRLAGDAQQRLWAIFKTAEASHLLRFAGDEWQPQPLPELGQQAPTGLVVRLVRYGSGRGAGRGLMVWQRLRLAALERPGLVGTGCFHSGPLFLSGGRRSARRGLGRGHLIVLFL